MTCIECRTAETEPPLTICRSCHVDGIRQPLGDTPDRQTRALPWNTYRISAAKRDHAKRGICTECGNEPARPGKRVGWACTWKMREHKKCRKAAMHG